MPEKYEVRVDAEIKELIPEFLANRDRDVVLLREASVRDDYRAMERIAHKMKGAGGSYGFARIFQYGVEIGKAALDKDTRRLAELVDGLADYLARVEVRYK